MSERTVGAILAGGQSRRMGAPKAGARLGDGRTLSRAVADALGAVCDEVVVLGHGEGCPDELQRVPDPPGAQGPLAGLLALLQSDRGARYLVAACDMPRLTPSLLERLLDESEGVRATCFHVVGRERVEPLPLLLTTAARAALEEQLAEGDLRLMAFVERLAPRELPLDEREAEALANVNRPEDLARLSATRRGPP